MSISNVILSYSQHGIYLADQKSGKPLYNVALGLRIRGNLNMPIFEDALKDLVNRHQILRMKTSLSPDGDVIGVVDDESEIFFKRVFIDNQKPSQEKIQSLINHYAGLNFDLANDQLAKFYLIKLDANQFIFIIVIHHIITDEWSNSILINELFKIYHSYYQKKKPDLLTTKCFFEYAKLEREFLLSDKYESHFNYWRDMLHDAPSFSGLQSSQLSNNGLSLNTGGLISLVMNNDQYLKVKTFCKNNQVSLFIFLMTIFNIVIARLGNRNDNILGYSCANRMSEEFQNTIGPFVNILPLRVVMNSQDSFTDLLKKVSITVLNSYEHQMVPFFDINKRLGESDRTRQPIFQTLLVMLEAQNKTFKGDHGLDITFLDIESQLAKFDLTLFVKETDKLELIFNYAKNIYDSEMIRSVSQVFINVIDYVLKFPKTSIEQISILNAHQEKFILHQIAEKSKNYDYQNQSLYELFTDSVKRRREKIAIKTEEKEYNYSNISDEVNQLAKYFVKLGISDSDRIVFLLEPCKDLMICIIALLKLKAIYVPISMKYPINMIHKIVKRISPKLVVVDELNYSKVESITVPKLRVNELMRREKILKLPQIIKNQKDLNGVAMIFHTSGSEGMPKSVLYKDSSLCNRIIWLEKEYPVFNDEVTIAIASSNFVDSLTETLLPMIMGVQVIMPNINLAINPDKLLKYLSKYNVTRLNIIPTLLGHLIENIKNSNYKLNLKIIEVSGEKFDLNLMQLAASKFRSSKLIDRYGLTEATSILYNEIKLDSDNNLNINSKFLDNTSISIVDKNLFLLPHCIEGEVIIAGAPLAKGYFEEEKKATKKFLKNSFLTSNNNENIFRTGDVGYFSSDGNLFIIGRKDRQIKINGIRVDTEALSSLISLDKYADKAVVVNLSNNSSFVKLGCLVVLNHNYAFTQHELVEYYKEYAIDNLPSYALPVSWAFVDKMPLNDNGKFDFRAATNYLINHGSHISAVNNESNHSLSQDEKNIIDVWGNFLQIDTVPIDTDFFELGGNSILVIRVLAMLKKKYSYLINIDQFYKNPTIRRLARIVCNKGSRNTTLSTFINSSELKKCFINDLDIKNFEGYLPVLPNRHSYFYKRVRNLLNWNVCLAFDLNKQINIEALQYATEKVIINHQGLRLKLIENKSDNHGYTQVIADRLEDVIYTGETLCSVKNCRYKNFVETSVDKIQNSFVFSGGFFKIFYTQTKGKFATIVFIIHHLLTDIYSTRLIVNDFFNHYSNFLQNNIQTKEQNLFSLIHYSAYYVNYWENEYKKHIGYWENLKWEMVQPIPLDFAYAKNLNIEKYTSLSRFTLEDEEINNRLRVKNNNRVLETLITAISHAYFSWTDNRVINLALLMLGRENFSSDIDLTNAVGYFAEFVPLVIEAQENPLETIVEVRRQLKYINQFGKSYGASKYLSKKRQIIDKFRKFPDPEISLNFLWDFINEANSVPNPNVPNFNEAYSFSKNKPDTHRVFKLSGGASANNGKLWLSWDYSSRLFKKNSVDYFTNLCLSKFCEIEQKYTT